MYRETLPETPLTSSQLLHDKLAEVIARFETRPGLYFQAHFETEEKTQMHLNVRAEVASSRFRFTTYEILKESPQFTGNLPEKPTGVVHKFVISSAMLLAMPTGRVIHYSETNGVYDQRGNVVPIDVVPLDDVNLPQPAHTEQQAIAWRSLASDKALLTPDREAYLLGLLAKI